MYFKNALIHCIMSILILHPCGYCITIWRDKLSNYIYIYIYIYIYVYMPQSTTFTMAPFDGNLASTYSMVPEIRNFTIYSIDQSLKLRVPSMTLETIDLQLSDTKCISPITVRYTIHMTVREV